MGLDEDGRVVVLGQRVPLTLPDEFAPRGADIYLRLPNGVARSTLTNAVLAPAAGSESGRIGNLNPQSALKKK